MAVALRLKRLGRRNRPFYRICVFNERDRRDGAPIEEIGHYDPVDPAPGKKFDLNEDRARYWISVGAQPSETVASLLAERGIEVPYLKPRSARRRAKAAARATAQ
ncbi:MAG: 30S ribosomal protein S16 [Planctomycetota bacterium]|nr:30S ribosomal protein S16 [Planctomycetota bacterium]